MNLYVVTVKPNSYNDRTEQLNIVASTTTRASELAMAHAKRIWGSPEIKIVAYDRAIHRMSK